MTGQPALFYHGGYGHQVVTTVAYCEVCPWSLVRSVASERPPR